MLKEIVEVKKRLRKEFGQLEEFMLTVGANEDIVGVTLALTLPKHGITLLASVSCQLVLWSTMSDDVGTEPSGWAARNLEYQIRQGLDKALKDFADCKLESLRSL